MLTYKTRALLQAALCASGSTGMGKTFDITPLSACRDNKEEVLKIAAEACAALAPMSDLTRPTTAASR